MLRRWLLSLLLCFCPIVLAAQADPGRTVVDDLIARITYDVNDLRYADALRNGRALVARGTLLAPDTRIRLHLLMAAAHFPEERALQQRDSAVAHLTAALRLAPDVMYPADLRWRGLDALLETTRASTLAAVLRAPPSQTAGGLGDGAVIEVVASRGAAIEVRLVARDGATVMRQNVLDSDRSQIRLAVHDGERVTMVPGRYDLILTARSSGTADSIVVHYVAVLEGALPQFDPEPAPLAGTLLPESGVPDRSALVVTGVVTAVASVVIASLARRDADLRATYAADSRAYIAAGGVLAVVAPFALRPRPRPIPANIAANVAARRTHDLALSDVRARNTVLLASYRGALTVVPAPR